MFKANVGTVNISYILSSPVQIVVHVSEGTIIDLYFSIVSFTGTDPIHVVGASGHESPEDCASFINEDVYSAEGGATGGQVDSSFCLHYRWACEAYCQLQKQAQRISQTFNRNKRWTLNLFNGGLGVDFFLATIAYGSYPVSVVGLWFLILTASAATLKPDKRSMKLRFLDHPCMVYLPIHLIIWLFLMVK